jgi:RNA polymerase sigma-70 factor (ECF subfamily)
LDGVKRGAKVLRGEAAWGTGSGARQSDRSGVILYGRLDFDAAGMNGMAEAEVEVIAQAAKDRDADVWRGLLEGAPEAAQALCTRFGPKLLSFAAARFPQDQQLAEDIMVQALAAAARHIRWYDPRRSVFAVWMYGVARREMHNELRRQRRRKSIPPAAQTPLESAAEVPDGHDVAEATAARLEAQRSVGVLVEALSKDELEVLVLSSIEELSVREIGRVVGRSERAVHSLLHRARTKARERLADHER